MDNKTVWIWQLKDESDAAFKKLDKKFDQVNRDVDALDKKDPFVKSRAGADKFQKNLQGIRSEVPMIDRGLGLLASPIGVAAIAAGGLFAVLRKGNQEAQKFNNQFLELKNLNLDKTEKQIERLRGSVLNTSYASGMDASSTSTAFFDVQSATGKFGSEVNSIVSKLAKFSTATKADFNGSVEGAAKSIGIFNIKARELDQFLASSAKTVQVGITTFDQLAKVQVEYAGAAAAANQGFDEGNKLFALFSKNAKSVDIAANLTKTAFQDLTKGSTVKGFEKIGVSLFDAKGGMLGIDRIADQLVPKLKDMSDQDFAKFKESVGGSEGIKALLDQLKTSGDGVLQLFNDFDNSKFNLDDAFKNALNDAETLSNFLDNRLKTSYAELGQALQPSMNYLTAASIQFLDNIKLGIHQIRNDFDSDYANESTRNSTASKMRRELNSQFDRSKFEGLSDDQRKSVMAKWQLDMEKFRKQEEGRPRVYDSNSNDIPIYQGKNKGKADFLAMLLSEYSGNKKANDIIDTTGDNNASKTAITGIESVNKMRNITVNIGSLVQELRYYTEQGGMTDQDIEAKMTELLVRAVRDAEIAISN